MSMDIYYTFSSETFVWDKQKAEANIRKHGIAFEDAVMVFQDENVLIGYDADHSCFEDRYLATGIIKGHIISLVVFTDREEITRIISARKATREEKQKYEQRK